MKLTVETARQIIESEHIAGGKSLRLIERERGFANGCLSRFSRVHNIPTRSKSEQALKDLETGRRIPATGEQHWLFGKTKDTSEHAAMHSRRMTADNPVHRPGMLEQRAQSRSVEFASAPTVHEQLMLCLLNGWGIDFEFQFPVGKYILDFAFPKHMVNLELDGRGHASRKLQDVSRDTFLCSQGWTVCRVAQDSLWNTRTGGHPQAWGLVNTLKALVPDFEKVSTSIPSGGKYRVLIRNKENCA
jgi:very-short-patch-repair endonuclease